MGSRTFSTLCPMGCSPIRPCCVHLLSPRSGSDPVSADSTPLRPFRAVLRPICDPFGAVGAVFLANPCLIVGHFRRTGEVGYRDPWIPVPGRGSYLPGRVADDNSV